MKSKLISMLIPSLINSKLIPDHELLPEQILFLGTLLDGFASKSSPFFNELSNMPLRLSMDIDILLNPDRILAPDIMLFELTFFSRKFLPDKKTLSIPKLVSRSSGIS